ncbi:unnamed protein product, partial [marine sediment metagenome]
LRKEYDAAERDLRKDLAGRFCDVTVLAASAMNVGGKLRQICSGAIY